MLSFILSKISGGWQVNVGQTEAKVVNCASYLYAGFVALQSQALMWIQTWSKLHDDL